MRKLTKYAVNYGRDIACFSNRNDAIRFARLVSKVGSIWAADGGAEVTAPGGLIAQFRDGRATPEFQHLDNDLSPARVV